MNALAIQIPAPVSGVVIRRLYRFGTNGEIHPIFELAITQYTGAKCMIPYGIPNLMEEHVSIGDTLTVYYDNHKRVIDATVLHTSIDQPVEHVYPRNCPICGSTLYSKDYVSDPEGVRRSGNVCFSSRCHAKAFHRIGIFLAAAQIELEKTDRRILHHLITRGVVHSPDTLMKTTFDQIMEMENVFVTKEDAVHFLESIDKYRGVSMSHFLSMLYGYGIPHLHRSALETLFAKVTNRYMSLGDADRMKIFVTYLLTIPEFSGVDEMVYSYLPISTENLDYASHALRKFFQMADNRRSLIQLLEWYFGIE